LSSAPRIAVTSPSILSSIVLNSDVSSSMASPEPSSGTRASVRPVRMMCCTASARRRIGNSADCVASHPPVSATITINNVTKPIAMAPETNRVAYHNANRRPKVRVNAGTDGPSLPLFSGPEDIAHASHRVQQLFLERPIDLLAQPAHQHVDDVGLRVEVVLPHVRQDHRLRD